MLYDIERLVTFTQTRTCSHCNKSVVSSSSRRPVCVLTPQGFGYVIEMERPSIVLDRKKNTNVTFFIVCSDLARSYLADVGECFIFRVRLTKKLANGIVIGSHDDRLFCLLTLSLLRDEPMQIQAI
jgi:ribosomal protein S27AE